MSGPLLTADLPWLLYRAHFAMPSTIVGADGEPVGALLGTVNALLTVVAALAPRAVVACSGPESAAYRLESFPAYHAQRPPMPAELACQWQRAPALLERLGWTVLESVELEADDLMYSLACVERESGGQALILTADRDLYQAVAEGVAVVVLEKGRVAGLIDEDEVRRRYGVPPALVPDFIALRGDPSDGIPGASGIGAKTARDLLVSYGSLEGTIAGALRERPRVAGALRDQADQLRMFKRIATLVRVPLERPPDRATDYAGGALAARELGMNQLSERLERLAGKG